MKSFLSKLSIVLLIIVCGFTLQYTNAQAPQKMSYQAVIRNTGNALVANTTVGIKISIIQTSPTGTDVFVERHTPVTNVNGLATVEIGGGTLISGTFSSVDWSNGPYFIKTETDPTGGTSYTITGTSQLLSVPYALYAKSANTHYIGEPYGGGIVFYVYDNGQHGLIAATVDQSTGIRWFGGSYTNTGAIASHICAGSKNTLLIIANQVSVDGFPFAATVCYNYPAYFGDWYLPSFYELYLLYNQKTIVGGFTDNIYWSSTELESNLNRARYINFTDGFTYDNLKSVAYHVRAIRSF